MKRAALFLFLLTTLVFNACETVVDLDLPEHKPALVANCLFNPDSVMEVVVSNSAGSLDNSQKIQANNTATVEVYENGQFKETLTGTGNGGVYRSLFKPLPSKYYQLKIRSTGYEEIDAISGVPVAVPITSFSFADSVYTDQFDGYQSQVSLVINDPAGEINYYSVELFTYDTAYLNFPPGPGDTALIARNIYVNSGDDPASAGFSYGTQTFYSGEVFDGKSYTLKVFFSSYQLSYGTRLFAVFHTISKEMFLYFKTYNEQMASKDNPFSEPVRVYNNIHRGFGIFAGYSNQTLQVK